MIDSGTDTATTFDQEEVARLKGILRNHPQLENEQIDRLVSEVLTSYSARRELANAVTGAAQEYNGHSYLQAGGERSAVSMAVLLRPAMIQTGVVAVNVAALLYASASTGNCFHCMNFDGPGPLRTVQVLGRYLAPSTFMILVDTGLAALSLLPYVASRIVGRSLALSQAVRENMQALAAAGIVAGIVEFAVLSLPQPTLPTAGNGWVAVYNVQLIVANFLVLIICLLFAVYRTNAEHRSRTVPIEESEHHPALARYRLSDAK